MALCFSDTETDAEEILFQKILSARWLVEQKGKKLYGRITTQGMALRIDRWPVLTDRGILYINFGSGRQLESISEARPVVIAGPNGVSINYYCCITSYLNEEPIEIEQTPDENARKKQEYRHGVFTVKC